MSAYLLPSLLLLSNQLFSTVNAEVATEPVLVVKGDNNWGAPCIIEENGFYTFATTNSAGNVPVAYSSDFKTWNAVKSGSGSTDFLDAMPKLPSWTSSKSVWAPDVNKLDNGTFIMYFASVQSGTGIHCIGAAYSTNVTGPYTPQADPWYCPDSPDQAIDPDGFRDPSTGKRYITFKWNQRSNVAAVDDLDLERRAKVTNCTAQGPPWAPTPITLQEVEADGVTKIGQNFTLVNNNGAADQGNTESPSLMRSPVTGNYVLFFSTGCFMDSSYTVSYAVSTGDITGPYTRHSNPLFQTGEFNLEGPGTLDVLDGGLYTVFFSHQPENTAPPNGRKLRTALIDVVGTDVMTNGTLPSDSTSATASGTGSTSASGSNPTSSSGSSSESAAAGLVVLDGSKFAVVALVLGVMLLL